jgi:glucan phosphoethanolaminetransferase (alkaline phosphatase superfamily)
MNSIAYMELIMIILTVLIPLILLNIGVYIVKKEIIKTTLRRSLKVFLITMSFIFLLGLIFNFFFKSKKKSKAGVEVYTN